MTGDRRTETNDRVSGCTVLLRIEKMNQMNEYQKLLEIEKEIVREVALREAFVPLTGLICAFRSADFLR